MDADDWQLLGVHLYAVALVLVGVFLALVLNTSLPLRPGDPRWLQQLIQVLLSQGWLPLIGLVLMHLAVFINPDSSRLSNRRDRYTQLAWIAALGFLLLVPLQLACSWGSLNVIATRQEQQRSQGLQVIAQLRLAATLAESHQDLDQRLRALPVTLTRDTPSANPAQPFALRQ